MKLTSLRCVKSDNTFPSYKQFFIFKNSDKTNTPGSPNDPKPNN